MCYKIWSRENYLKNRGLKLERQKERRAADPIHVREIERKSQIKNRAKRNKYQKQWAANNPEKRKQYRQNWGAKNKQAIVDASHRRRAKIRNATIQKISKADLKKILKRPCIYCGNKSQEIDHVIPLVRGGSHTLGNLAPSCRPCNQRKHDKLVIEWKASMKND